PVGKSNYCSITTKALGKSCNNKDECRSKKCNKGKCVCKKNSDCPSGKTCKKKVTGANKCQ
ncbi:MAG: hypothetical protein ACPGQS_05165, partial [Bradymonadia bacterium]